MNAISARLARAVNRVAERHVPVLSERYHHRTLTSPREVHRALRYVLLNARRHAAKTRRPSTARPRLDPASSARWFDGSRAGAIGLEEEGGGRSTSDRPAVARPRLWLVTVGWRRHGLLDPRDVRGTNPGPAG